MATLVKVVHGIITRDPETAAKTVTTTAAELFAGVTALANRGKMFVYNADTTNTVYWGKGTITTTTGFPLLPGDSIVFSFDPGTYVPIYFIAATDVVVRVGETA